MLKFDTWHKNWTENQWQQSDGEVHPNFNLYGSNPCQYEGGQKVQQGRGVCEGWGSNSATDVEDFVKNDGIFRF